MTSARRALVAIFLALFAAACGGGDDAEPATTTAAQPTTTTTIDTLHREEVLGGPDWLAADDNWVYVRRDNGGVDRIDPATGAVETSIEIEGGLCQGLGAGESTVWTCNGTDIVQVAFDAGGVVRTVPVGKAATQGTLPVAGGRVWVLVGDGSQLVGVEVANGAMGRPLTLGVRGSDAVTDGQAVYVISGPDRAVVKVDIASGAVVWRADGVAASTVAAGEGTVWAGGAALMRLDAATGAILGTAEAGPGGNGGLAVDAVGVWVRSSDRFLELVSTEGQVVESFPAEVTSGGDVLVAHGAVWATAYDDAALFRLNRS